MKIKKTTSLPYNESMQRCRVLRGQGVGLGGKDKCGKSSLSSVPLEPTIQVARVFKYGAAKYGLNNWRKGHRQLDLIDSCLRHVYAHTDGHDIDGESGLPHLAHAASNLFILIQQIRDKTSVDDRFKFKQTATDIAVEEAMSDEEADDNDGEKEEEMTPVGMDNNRVIDKLVPHWDTDHIKYCQ